MSPGLTITPLTPDLGAEVTGFDPRDPDAFAVELREALLLHHLLVVRARTLQPAEQIALGRVFGEPEVFLPHPSQLADHPQLRRFSNRREEGYDNRAQYWHSDGTILPKPTAFSLWHLVKHSTAGGDTLFTNTHLAYETLPPRLRTIADRLMLVSRTGAIHKTVKVHPVTGRRALYISIGLTKGFVGVDRETANKLLSAFDQHLSRPGTFYSHRWREGDVIIGDNFSVAHRATPADASVPRTLHRVTVGEAEAFYQGAI